MSADNLILAAIILLAVVLPVLVVISWWADR